MKKVYQVNVSVEIPYPKHMTFRVEAGQVHTAVASALKLAKKETGRKIIKEWKIHAVSLGGTQARMLTSGGAEDEAEHPDQKKLFAQTLQHDVV